MKAKLPRIRVVRSKKRRKTIQAKFVKKTREVIIYLPENMPRREEKKWVRKMAERVEKKRRKQKLNANNSLMKETQKINQNYFKGKLKFKISYVVNQKKRFGSCTPGRKTIRISDKIVRMPKWVRNYVIIHELSHLIQSNHSKKFWNLVNQYKLAERARGYLIARGMESDEEVK